LSGKLDKTTGLGDRSRKNQFPTIHPTSRYEHTQSHTWQGCLGARWWCRCRSGWVRGWISSWDWDWGLRGGGNTLLKYAVACARPQKRLTSVALAGEPFQPLPCQAIN